MSTFAATKQRIDGITTESDIQRAVGESWFQEGHHLDLKATGYANAKSMEQAHKDLGAMAFDGGFLLLGISEEKESASFSPSPFPIKGEQEYLDDAASKLSPPLRISTRNISASAGGGNGYVIVEILPSTARVHATPRGYVPWRHDVVTRYLTADERRALDEDYERREKAFLGTLSGNPRWRGGDAPGRNGHRYTCHVVAEPMFPVRQLLDTQLLDDVENLRGPGFAYQTVKAAADSTATMAAEIGAHQEFHLGGLVNAYEGPWIYPTDTGVGMESVNADSGMIHCSIESAGRVDIQVANIGDHLLSAPGEEADVIDDAAVLVLILQTVEVVRRIVGTTGYQGPWRFGLYLTTNDALPLSIQPQPGSLTRQRLRGSVRTVNHFYSSASISGSGIGPTNGPDTSAQNREILRQAVGSLMHQWGVRPYWVQKGLM